MIKKLATIIIFLLILTCEGCAAETQVIKKVDPALTPAQTRMQALGQALMDKARYQQNIMNKWHKDQENKRKQDKKVKDANR
jgi:hypothetical protein